ncbi:hypothetical protein [Rhizorhapis sp.]|uniref:hypothetical protein n=1 Tax=Rhizorhapis sp. TaxID=1968842 RepID=UPI002B496F6A|nr:hypothetical protein [Rhizorhapis sp.]HKR16081.1 hypothetical protein [Rhizorhapis sp.]HKX36538.1 hypothetical protein [Rhizorhapis sp.]
MLGFAAFAVSFITMFIFSSASRNARHSRPHSPKLRLAGYFLCGLLFGSAVLLTMVAAVGILPQG